MSGNCFHDQELSRFYLSFVVEFVMSCFESFSDVNNCVYPVPDVSVRQSYRSEDSLHRLFKTDLEGSTRILILRLLTTSSGCIFGIHLWKKIQVLILLLSARLTLSRDSSSGPRIWWKEDIFTDLHITYRTRSFQIK